MQCPKDGIRYFGCGEEAATVAPGDFILVTSDGFTSKLIKYGQHLRFPTSPYTKWCHTALITSVDGSIIEANGKTIAETTLSKYKDKEYILVSITASVEDRQEAVAFARSRLGERYGIITIVSIALSLLSGLKFSFGFDGQEVCSGLVARALERTQAIFPRDPSHITPSELASYYLESH